jgi:hypothetical protein
MEDRLNVAELTAWVYARHPEGFKVSEKTKEYNRRCSLRWGRKNRLSVAFSGNMRHSLKGNKSGNHWETLVNYTVTDLRKHLEKQFNDGMTWDNYGKWHIDHITPVSAFNFDKPSDMDFKRCWALSNLRPLWAKENHQKINKIIKPFQPSIKGLV